jgi:hypothetical protein
LSSYAWVAIFFHYVLTGLFEYQTIKIRYAYLVLNLSRRTVAFIQSVPMNYRKCCWTAVSLGLGGSKFDVFKINHTYFSKSCFQALKHAVSPLGGSAYVFLLHNVLSRLLVKYVLAAQKSSQPRLPAFLFSDGLITLCNNENGWCSVDLNDELLRIYRLDDRSLVRICFTFHNLNLLYFQLIIFA